MKIQKKEVFNQRLHKNCDKAQVFITKLLVRFSLQNDQIFQDFDENGHMCIAKEV